MPRLKKTSQLVYQQPINWKHPLNKGLVAWWKVLPFTKGGLTFRDLCNRHHCTLTNMNPAIAWVASDRRGSFGSLQIDGTDDVIVTGPLGVSGATPRTVSMLFKTDDLLARALFDSGADTSFGLFSLFITAGGGTANLYVYTNGFDVYTGDNVVAIGQWYHVAVTYNGGSSAGDIKIYLNGVSLNVSMLGGGPLASTDEAFWIGSYVGGAGSQWNGAVDDIRVHNRCLSATEVAALYRESFNTSLLNYRSKRIFFSSNITSLINTENKRRSVRFVLPRPDGSINTKDRRHANWIYRFADSDVIVTMSENKRRSIIFVLPAPDGDIATKDRRHSTWQYRFDDAGSSMSSTVYLDYESMLNSNSVIGIGNLTLESLLALSRSRNFDAESLLNVKYDTRVSLLNGLQHWYDLRSNANDSVGSTPGTNHGITFDGFRGTGDGSHSIYGFGSSIFGNATTRSIAFWLNTPNVSTRQGICANRPPVAAQGFGVCMNRVAGGYLEYLIITGGAAPIHSNIAISANTPTFVVVTHDIISDTVKWYINGVLTNTGTPGQPESGSSSNGVIFDEEDDGVGTFVGSLWSFGIWNRVLNATEITSLYNNGNSLYYNDLLKSLDYESLLSSAVFVNAVGNFDVESLAKLTTAKNTAFENIANLIRSSVLDCESILSLLGARTIDMESLGGLALPRNLDIESSSKLLLGRVGDYESLLSVLLGRTEALESLLGVNRSSVFDYESLNAGAFIVTGTSVFTLESVMSLVAPQTGDYESLRSITIQPNPIDLYSLLKVNQARPMTFESNLIGYAAFSSVINFESASAVRFTNNVLNDESLRSLTQTNTVDLEAIAGILKSGQLDLNSTTNVTFLKPLDFESLRSLSTNQTVPLYSDLAIRATLAVTFPLEALGGVLSSRRFSYESDGDEITVSPTVNIIYGTKLSTEYIVVTKNFQSETIIKRSRE